ncbi:hypothetical protein ACFSL4_04305 [Streptomyces caeni]|uniref:Tetracycline repressor TetR C-terminal domain-containing protein n=1 Tax=Streptomyces caeni TaxID=2307231 RepID=A0ABW4ILR9_9ACTN
MELTAAFVRLLESGVTERASLRLARERAGKDLPTLLWLPAIAELVDRAFTEGHVRAGLHPEDVVDLTEYLTRGAEAHLRAELTTKPRSTPGANAQAGAELVAFTCQFPQYGGADETRRSGHDDAQHATRLRPHGGRPPPA